MSFETRKQDAEKVLRRWNRSNQSPAAQQRLIDDRERLWRFARDLAEALDNLLAHARSVQHGYAAVARRRWPAAEWIIGDGRYASIARCGPVTVMLFATPAEAERAKALIDRIGCSHACRRDHEITDLDETQSQSQSRTRRSRNQ
jgi:hypothetical protein